MYFYAFLNPQKGSSDKTGESVKFVLPEVELNEGDTIIFMGQEPLKYPEFYRIAEKYNKKGVRFIIETYGYLFYDPAFALKILKTYNIEEIRIKLYSLNPLINDRITSIKGATIKTLYGIENLLNHGFKNISIVTQIKSGDSINNLKALYNYKIEKGLKNLYINLDKSLPIEERIDIFEKILDRFKENKDVIVRNNLFEVRLKEDSKRKIEISCDKDNGIVNLVMRSLCSNNCPFCTTRIVQSASNSPLPYDSKEDLLDAIRRVSKCLKKRSLFEIVAVEPLEHPHLMNILKEIRRLGFERIRLLTHGRPLKRISKLKSLKELGVREIIIPISFYSPDSALNNVGDSNAYFDIKEALKNISSERDISFTFNIMISKQNYKDIEKIYNFLSARTNFPINFNLALPSISDPRFYIPYALKLTDLIKEIRRIKSEELKIRILSSLIFNIPPCLIIRYFGDEMLEKLKSSIKFKPGINLASLRKDFRYKNNTPCFHKTSCRYSNICPGINEIYIQTFGEKEFEAIK